MKHKRLFVAFIAIFLLLSNLLTALALHLQDQVMTRGIALATEPEHQMPFRAPLAGVNAELTLYNTPAKLETQLNTMEELGIKWVRQIFPWSEIEPESGVFHWERWDRIVEAFATRDSLRLVAVLHLSPPWARNPSATTQPTAPPHSSESFAEFAAVFAERYGDIIDFYQIWDEPNLTSAWGGLPPGAAEYANLLQAAYTTLHAADPSSATVIAAALAPTTEEGPDNYSDVLFLRALYELGADAYFDAAAGKPIGFSTGPDDRRVDSQILNFSRLVLLREEMVSWGDGEKHLWASAAGWNALPAEWNGSPSIWGGVTKNLQARYTEDALARAAAEWPWCGGVILHHWEPNAEQTDPVWGFAIEPDTNLQNSIAAAQPDNTRAALPGRHPINTPHAVYEGEWEFSELGGDFGYKQDSELTFTFYGTDLALELRRDNYRGYLYVTVDGQPANALQQDRQGQSYIILNSSDNQPNIDIIPVATGLTQGPHQIQARAEYGWDQWALVGYRVSIVPATHKELIAVLLGIGLLTGILLIRIMPFRELAKNLRLYRPLNSAAQLALAGLASLLMMLGMLLTWTSHTPTLLRRDWPGLLLGFMTTGLMYFSTPLLLTIAMAILLWFLIYIRLELGLLLTLAWAPFFLYPLALHEYAFPIAEVCILLTVSAWIVKNGLTWAVQQPRRFRRPHLNRTDWGVAAFFVAATVSLFWAEYQHVALREWRTMILEPVLFYTIARTSLRNKTEITRLVDAFVFGAAAAAAVSLVMYFSGEGIIIAEGASRRLGGIYGSPNNIGLSMGRALPFALAPLLAETTRIRKILAAVAAGIMVLAAALSQSAGALLLGIPASLFAMLFLWRRRYAVIAAGVAAAGGAALAYPVLQSPRFSRLLDFSSGTTFFRLRIWESALNMLRDRPLRGMGLDQFLYQYRGHYIQPDAWQEPNISHPHNIILDFWLRLGAAGVLILAWIQYSFWDTTIRLYKQLERNSLHALFNIAAMASMVDLLVHGMVDNSVFVIDLSFVFFFLLVVPMLITRAFAPASE